MKTGDTLYHLLTASSSTLPIMLLSNSPIGQKQLFLCYLGYSSFYANCRRTLLKTTCLFPVPDSCFLIKIKSKIKDLYQLTNVDFFNTYARISRDTILKIAGLYNANAYWEKRKLIGDHILSELDMELQKAYARCIYVQVLKIELPVSYEASIVNTQVEVQMTNMKQFEQEAELTRQGIDVIKSEAQQKIKITNATGIAESYRLKQFAKV